MAGVFAIFFWRRRSKTSKDRVVIERIENYVDTHYAQAFSVADLAKVCFLSEGYVGKIFKRGTGKSLNQYVNEVRVEKALVLIKTTAKTISEIHYEVGIKNASYFSKIFKEILGSTPSEALKKYR